MTYDVTIDYDTAVTEAHKTVETITAELIKQEVVRLKERHLLREAYRRKMMFCPEKPLRVAWVGLGTPSRYKSPYFEAVGKEVPRANNWYILSKAGIEVMDAVIAKCPFPDNIPVKTQLNHLLFTL